MDDREAELEQRKLESLRHAMGPLVLNSLEDPEVVEVFLNPDGLLWEEKFGSMRILGEMSVHDANAFLRQVASSLPDQSLSFQDPIIEGELPLGGHRFEAVAGPVVERPMFNIRKKASRVYPFAEYVQKGVIPFKVAEMLRKSIREEHNILVVGGTGSGKTTFCNAILHAMGEEVPDTRMIILEDTRELQCPLVNKACLKAYKNADMRRLSQVLMRVRPDRISVGEIRAGAVALEVLKLWNTGHPGGLTTIHANSAYKGLSRLVQLMSEVTVAKQYELVGEAVQVVVFMARTNKGRRVKEVLRVHGYDDVKRRFETEVLYEE